jgi:homoserine kinase type II
VAIFTPLESAEVSTLASAYEIGDLRAFSGIPAGSVNSNFSVETPRGRWFLRVYEEQDLAGAEAETRLLLHLAARGVPTPAPVPRRDGRLVSKIAEKPAALFPWQQGGMRCQAAVSPEDAKRVGAALAHVHVQGEGAERGAGRFRDADLLVRLDRIANAEDPSLAAHAAPLRARIERWSRARDPSLRRGLVHGDLFRDNVLWSETGDIVALLDFESASDGVLAYDLAVTILAWCVGERLDVDLARAMVAGYQHIRSLDPAERRGFLAEACMAALRFAITRITDYAMRAGVGPRVMKDYRRFVMRLDALEALGQDGLTDALGL